MRRRELIAGCVALVIGPGRLLAQQQSGHRIGMLGPVPFGDYGDRIAHFRDGLRLSGFTEPTQLPIEYLWPGSQNSPWPPLVDELLRRRVSIIATSGDVAPRAAKAATSTIPIVFVMGGDPVEQGLITSLSRPGGNLTGVTTLNFEIHAKRIEILRELMPKARHLALLVNPSNRQGAETLRRETEQVALPRGFTIRVLGASTDNEIDAAFEQLATSRPDALIIGANVLFNARSRQLGLLAARHAIPTIYQTPEFVRGGGLLGYGSNIGELFRVQGSYVGRILNGQKPADLPVQQASRIEMTLNLKAAKALGIEVPTAILVRADEVIE